MDHFRLGTYRVAHGRLLVLHHAADAREPRPERRAMEREVMQLAAYKLCAEDRTLLKWILRGKSVSQMGRDLNLCQSATQQRVNGLLWTLRCRADLAAYLEVQPAEIIPRNTSRHAMAVSKFPPAKRAM